jgi:hypothetical protein
MTDPRRSNRENDASPSETSEGDARLPKESVELEGDAGSSVEQDSTGSGGGDVERPDDPDRESIE